MLSNPEQDNLLNDIIERLAKKTESGEIRWQESDQPDTFISSVGPNSVALTGVISLPGYGLFPEIVVRDPAGNTRAAGGGMPRAAMLSLRGRGIDFSTLEKLATAVRKQMTEVDPVLLEMQRDLSDE